MNATVSLSRLEDTARRLATAVQGPQHRVEHYLSDQFLPPGVVVGLPDVQGEGSGGFCLWRVTWPLVVVVARASSERLAQAQLLALLEHTLTGLRILPDAQVTQATYQPVTVAGQEHPAYRVLVQVIV
jgi:hypothetical protein